MRTLVLIGCWLGLCTAALADAARTATNSSGQTIAVRDIADPANPYAGQYSALDQWIWENYAAALPADLKELYSKPGDQAAWDEYLARQPEHWSIQNAEVDEQGWLIPADIARQSYRMSPRTLRQEVNRDYGQAELKQRQATRYHLRAIGILGPELRALQAAATNRNVAENIPRIPAWLGSRPPLELVLVPNGEYLAHGPLNLHLQKKDPGGTVIYPNGSMVIGEDWYRYSPDGRLLGTYQDLADGPHGFRWQDVYSDMSLVEQSFKDRGIKFGTHYTTGGYRVYVANEEGKPAEILGAYDYAGQPVDPDATLVDSGDYLGSQLPQNIIEHWFTALVSSGLVDPDEQSPWEGTPQGPVAVDPAPRPPRLVAQRSHVVGQSKRGTTFAGMDYVVVKALDDPANPYRDQYQPWDHWMFGQVNQRNPRESEWREQLRQARANGVPQKREQSLLEPMFQPSFDDPWRTFSIKVDDNGYVIPFMQGRADAYRQRMQPAKWDSMYLKTPPPNHYQLQAGGVMPDEIKRALLAELRRQIPERFPPEVPAWLQAAPPYMFHRMPNGEYVTEGLLGSWTENWQQLEEQAGLDRKERYLRHGWFRYSAAGELLGSVQSDSWTELYNPSYRALRAEGLAAGYTAWESGGYLAWYTQASGPGIDDDPGGDIVRKWDYLGNEVPANTTWYRPDGALRQWRWEDVLRAQRGELPDWI